MILTIIQVIDFKLQYNICKSKVLGVFIRLNLGNTSRKK